MTKKLFLSMLLFLVIFLILIAAKHFYLAWLCGAPIYLIWGIWGGRYINKGWE